MEVKEGDGDDQGHRVLQRTNDPSMAIEVEEEIEEASIKEDIAEVIGKAIKKDEEIKGEGITTTIGNLAPPSYVPRMDALLGDIYELRY